MLLESGFEDASFVWGSGRRENVVEAVRVWKMCI
jgi:hypothetical protein